MAQSPQLRIPGPTPVPDQINRAMAAPMINHRGPEFKALLPELESGLKWAFQTENDMLIFPASGTGGLESAVANLISPGEPTYMIGQNFVAGQAYSKVSGYADPTIETLLKRAYAENDEAALKPIYAELMAKLAEDCPYVWLGFLNAANLWRSSITDFKVNQGITMDVRSTGFKA